MLVKEKTRELQTLTRTSTTGRGRGARTRESNKKKELGKGWRNEKKLLTGRNSGNFGLLKNDGDLTLREVAHKNRESGRGRQKKTEIGKNAGSYRTGGDR